jgi:endonuclease/exonuclease/phosphatase family metal-dependent hydrolase
VDYLKVNFQNDYATLDAGRDAMTDIVKKPAGGEHLMIMYRKSRYALLNSGFFWMSETPEKPSFGWDAKCRRVTVWGLFRDKKTGDEFYFFDTHFDHVGHSARRNEAVMITAKMKEIAGEKHPVIVCGDFNTTVNHDALAPIRDWMQDARSTAPVSDKFASFNGWGKHELWIDHIFYRRCKILGYKTIVNDKEHYGVPFLSDHNPIIGYFKL